MKLSERDTAALLALAAIGAPATGMHLAEAMTKAGRRTSIAAAHQAGADLWRRGLAQKGDRTGQGHIRYELTDRGRELAGGAQ